MEIQITLTKEELDCLTNALEQRLGYVDHCLLQKSGSKDYYDYFEQDKLHIIDIFQKIDSIEMAQKRAEARLKKLQEHKNETT